MALSATFIRDETWSPLILATPGWDKRNGWRTHCGRAEATSIPNADDQSRIQARKTPKVSGGSGACGPIRAFRGKKLARPRIQPANCQHTQFADFHSPRLDLSAPVFKTTDRKGNLLDQDDKIVPFDNPEKAKEKLFTLKRYPISKKGMHLQSTALSSRIAHGKTANLRRKTPRNWPSRSTAVDCHGTIQQRAPPSDFGHSRACRRHESCKDCGNAHGRNAASIGKMTACISRSMLDKRPKGVGSGAGTPTTITPGNAHYSGKNRD